MSLKRRLSQPGIALSAGAHIAVLVATLVAFSQTEKFDDQQETVPVEVITDNQFNQIMKGDKSAKAVNPKATAAVEQAESPETPTPTPADTKPPPPAPPPPPVAAQPPPPRPTVRPPPRPPMPAQETPPVPTPPVRDVPAEEAVLPKPVPKPAVKPPPLPPVVPHVAVKPPPKPHPDKPKVDLAKLIDNLPDTPPTPVPPKPAPARPKPAPPAAESKPSDLNDLTKLFQNHDTQPSHPAPSHAQSASLGAPTASAQEMSPSFWAGLDGLLEDQYRGCWSYLGLAAGAKYVPQVRVVYAQDGSLEGTPVLINPPHDPALQSLADSAMRAVRRCNPLKIPEQYAPYYEQWKGRVLRFDPEEMAG